MILNSVFRRSTHKSLLVVGLLFSTLLALTSPANAKHILIYGDSLSAAYGMDEEKGWVNLLAETLSESHQVSNASISGETSGGGLARLKLTLEELKPELVFLELGANDGLRGYSTKLLKKNLQAMIDAIVASGAEIALAKISLPPTYGPRYIDQFRSVYDELAKEYDIPLIDLYQPSFVEAPGYIQEDGLHPTEITQPLVRDLILDFLTENDLLE